MVSPAVASPAVTPGSEGNPNPAPAGNEPSPGSGAPPQGAPDKGTPPEPGKGGQEPAGGGDPQTPPASGDEPKPDASVQPSPTPAGPEPRRQTQEEWQREQAAIKARLDADAEETAAAELVATAPTTARDLLDTLAEELDVRIPVDLRKPLLELVDSLTTTGTKGAEKKWSGQFKELKDTLDDTSLAFVGAMETAADRNKFADAVRGKEPKDWVKALIDIKTPAIAAKALENAAAAHAALLPEGEVRDGFVAKVKGETDPKKLAQTFHDALLGVVGPAGEPRVTPRPGGTGRPTLAEVTRRRSAGEYKSDAEFLKDQDLALQGT